MASVKIRLSDSHDLPQVCVYCGTPASMGKSKKYSTRPSWVTGLFFIGIIGWLFLQSSWLFLVWLIFSIILPRRLKLMMPVCPSHVNCGKWSTGLLIAGIATFVTGVVIAMSLMQTNSFVAECVLYSGAAVIVVAGLVAWVKADTKIAATEISDRWIKLNGVSEEFADALDDEPVQLVAVGGKAKPVANSGGGMELMTAKYMKR